MKATIQTITPDLAAKFLGQNKGNRRLRKNVVEKYTAAMASGEWKATGDPIRFSKEGNLIDGQHRLSAVIASGVTVEALVLEEVDESAMPVIDTGFKRQPSDAIRFAGVERYETVIAAGLRLVISYEKDCITDGRATDIVASRGALAERVKAEGPEFMEELALRARDVYDHLGGNPSAWFAFAYLSHKIDSDGAFMRSVKEGSNLDIGDPRLTLRNWIGLNAPRRGKSYSRFYAYEQLGTYIRCFNSWLMNEKRHKVQVYTRASKAFPKIASID